MSKKRPSKSQIQRLAHWTRPDGRNVHDRGVAMSLPPGAIKADLSKHAPHNSYGPPMWYVDQKRKCRDCGKEFTWTAKRQQHWFELLKIPIHVQAVRCAACGRKVRLAKEAQKQHMAEMARRTRHPKEDFFRPASKKKSRKQG
jgi:DNA-directed RNA polymerase subunit RPC12/RpoP